MRRIAVATLLVAGVLGLGPATAVAADSPGQHSAAPDSDVSVLAVSLTVGGALAAVASGVTFALNRRRCGSDHSTQSKVRVTALRQRV